MAYTLDPSMSLDDHQVIDTLIANGGFVETIAAPCVWTPCVIGHRAEVRGWRCVLGDAELAEWTHNLREVVKLPLYAEYMAVVELTLAESEAALEHRWRKWRVRGKDDWTDQDLVGEIAALCGAGILRSGEWWFRCPFHEERTASLHVHPDKHIWHCFGCGRGGGHTDWRREARLKLGKTPSP